MPSIGMSMRVLVRFCVVLIFIIAIAGCNVVNLSGNEQLPAISSLPLPKLPNWIERPDGQTRASGSRDETIKSWNFF